MLISTHSSECLRLFLTASNAAGSESAVFHLQREDGVLEANRLDSETVENLQSTGVDVRNATYEMISMGNASIFPLCLRIFGDKKECRW